MKTKEQPENKVGAWISVKDALPPFDKPVLGWIAQTKAEFIDYACKIVSLNEVRQHSGGRTISFRDESYQDYNELEITHWMYMPSPPEGWVPYVEPEKIKKK